MGPGSSNLGLGLPSSDSLPNSGVPTSLAVTSATDVMQAAGLINLALAQPSTSSFMLQAQAGPVGSPGSQAALTAALKIAITSRQMHAAAGTNATDLAMLPMFSSDGTPAGAAPQDAIDMHIYRVQVPQSILAAQASVLRIDPSGNPLTLAIQLAQLVSGTSGQGQGAQAAASGNPAIVDISFGAASAKVALQALAVSRVHMTNAGADAVLLPQFVEGAGMLPSFMVKAIPTALLLGQRVSNRLATIISGRED